MSLYITCDHCGVKLDTNTTYELQINHLPQTETHYLCPTCLAELQHTFFNHEHAEMNQKKQNITSQHFDQSVPENFIHQTLRSFLNAPAYLNQTYDIIFQDEYKKPLADYLQWLDKEIVNIRTDYEKNTITITAK